MYCTIVMLTLSITCPRQMTALITQRSSTASPFASGAPIRITSLRTSGSAVAGTSPSNAARHKIKISELVKSANNSMNRFRKTPKRYYSSHLLACANFILKLDFIQVVPTHTFVQLRRICACRSSLEKTARMHQRRRGLMQFPTSSTSIPSKSDKRNFMFTGKR